MRVRSVFSLILLLSLFASFSSCGSSTSSPAPSSAEELEVSQISDATQDDVFGIKDEEALELTASPSIEHSQQASNAMPALAEIEFDAQGGDSQVKATFTENVAFELEKTAPSEWVVFIPGASAAPNTKEPKIAPVGFGGIRSVRAVEDEEGVRIRLFAEPTTIVTANSAGSEILLAAIEDQGQELASEGSEARGQLADAENDTEARANPTGVQAEDGSKIYNGRLISLDLQDTDIDNALRIIAEVSNLNIIASDEVSGKVSLRLIDVPWDQALDVILKTNGLDQVREGNVIRIAPIDKLRQEREAVREAKQAVRALEDLSVQYIRISYARVLELREQVEAVISERGSVAVDERTNQLIIKDIREGQEAARNLVKRLDLRTPQVVLETQIVEGSRGITRDLGFQWNFNFLQSPETGNATGVNFPNTVGIGGGIAGGDGSPQTVDFPAGAAANEGSALSFLLDSADGSRTISARISALESEGKVKVISRPQVATVNNKPAEIKSVETVRVKLPTAGTSIATGAGASAAGGSAAFQTIDVGIQLSVTPQASPDYYVLMDVQAKSSVFSGRATEGIPNTVEREANSTILVKSGQTFALGGVYRTEDRDTVSGVPFLKDIPVLGTLFRRTLNDKSLEELIFFITPHIVEGSFDPGAMSFE